MKKLELFFSSPINYEILTVEIQLDREKIAEINRDKGVDTLEVELSDPRLDFLPRCRWTNLYKN